MVDALGRLYWKEFFDWAQAAEYGWRVQPLLQILEELYSEFNEDHNEVDFPRLEAKQLVRILLNFSINSTGFCT